MFLLLASSTTLYAERFDITANIGQIRYHEASSSLAPTWQKHVWFGLVNPDKTPNCYKYNAEYAISIPQGNETAISLLLSAKMASKQVVITIDDAVKFPNGQWCQLQYITIKVIIQRNSYKFTNKMG